MDEMRKKLKAIFEDVLDVDFESEAVKFNDNLKLGDVIDWDSLAQVSILAQVEKDFKIKFALDDLVALTSVGAIAQMIENKIQGQSL